MSATIRFTSGRVRLASARVKYFLGTETIYAEMLSPDDYYSLDKLRMRNKSHDSFVAVHYHDRRSNVRVRLFQLLDLEPRQLRLRCHHHRVAPPHTASRCRGRRWCRGNGGLWGCPPPARPRCPWRALAAPPPRSWRRRPPRRAPGS